MKNKKVFYIIILQISCVALTVIILLFMKYFSKDTFSKVKEKYNEYFGEETVIEEETETALPTAVTLKNNEVNSLCVPVKGVITSDFGYRSDPFTSNTAKHYGTDIAANKGTIISAAASGKVSLVGFDKNGYGNYLKIDHDGSFTTLYGHCSKITVKQGDYVERGQPVAEVGSTGRSTGNHLHFEVLIGGEPINAKWLMEF